MKLFYDCFFLPTEIFVHDLFVNEEGLFEVGDSFFEVLFLKLDVNVSSFVNDIVVLRLRWE
jgi:hypothetical protein